VGDAVAAPRIRELADAVRTRLHEPPAWTDAIVAVVESVCRAWPIEQMTRLARRPEAPASGNDTLDALAVITAKTREDLEHRYGATGNVAIAIDKLHKTVVLEIAEIWFGGPDSRVAIRSACREAWRNA
jgi:hypothetical protein